MKTIYKIFLFLLISGVSAFATTPTPPNPADAKTLALRRMYIGRIIDNIKAQYGAAQISAPFEGLKRKDDKKDGKKEEKKDDPNLSKSANAAKLLFDSLAKANKKLPDFKSDQAIEFPLLVNLVTEGNNQVALCFNDMKIYPGYAELSVFVKMRFGDWTFFFGADKMKYRENSQSGFFESARIVLLGDATYKTKSYTVKLKGGEIDSKGDMKSATSLLINCGKIETLKLGGELELNPETFIPIDSKGIASKDSSDRVKTNLDITVDLSDGFTKLSNPIFELSFTPFTLKSYKDKVGFKVDKITLDLSDKETPAGVTKVLEEIQNDKIDPKEKEKTEKEAKAKIEAITDKGEKTKAEKDKKEADEKEEKALKNDIKAWKGLYIAALEIYLPDELKGKDKDEKKDTTAVAKVDTAKKEEKEKKYKDLRMFGAKDLVIGDVGLTFAAYGYNVVRLNDDRPISKWDMSVDTVTIKFLNSSLKKFSIAGKIRIPTSESKCDAAKKDEKKDEKKDDKKEETKDGKTDVAKKDDPKTYGDNKDAASLMAYRGAMSLSAKVNNFSLAVDFPTKKKFGFLGGEAEFKANSGIELTLEKEKGKSAQFNAKLTLNGEWSFAVKTGPSTTKDIDKKEKSDACVGADTTQKTVGFRKVEFTKCEFMTKSPYFKLGNFTYSDTTNNVNNFPIFIEKFEAKTVSGEKKDDSKDEKKDGEKKPDDMYVLEVGVKFRVSLADNALSGKGDLAVLFDYGAKNEKFTFAYKEFKLNDISVKGDFSAFKFDGRLKMMKKDPDYGDGFMGRLGFTFGSDAPAGLTINMIYGKKDPVGRYFYGDIFLVKTGLFEVAAYGFQLNGVGLGFAYKMVPTKETSEFSSFGKKFIPKAGRASLIVGTIFSNYAKSPVKPGDAFDGKLNLMVNFGGRLGIASIMADGDIRIRAKSFEMPGAGKAKGLFQKAGLKENAGEKTETIKDKKDEAEKNDKKEDAKSGAFVANLGLEVNLERYDFIMEAAAYLDMGALRGGYNKGKIGDATMYIGKEGFYTWVGTPKTPLSVVLDIKEGVRAEGQAYLNIGKLPPSDQLARKYPDGLYAILDKANSKLKQKGIEPYTLFNPQEASRLNATNGILVGTSVNLPTADYTYGPFSATIGGGTGFDMMIASYKNGLCGDGTRIDGLYGQGQMYAYVSATAKVGIPKWKKLGPWRVSMGTFNGLVVGKAGVPTPFYLDGVLYGDYKFDINIGIGRLSKRVTVFDKEFAFNVKYGKPCTPTNGPVLMAESQRLNDLAQGVINRGHTFRVDEKIWSKEKEYYLVWRKDGDFATYNKHDKLIWESKLPGNQGATFDQNGVFINLKQQFTGMGNMNLPQFQVITRATVLVQLNNGSIAGYDETGAVVWTNDKDNAIKNRSKTAEELAQDKEYGMFVGNSMSFKSGQVYPFKDPVNKNEKLEMTFSGEQGIVIQAVNLSSGAKKQVYSWNHNKDYIDPDRRANPKYDPKDTYSMSISVKSSGTELSITNETASWSYVLVSQQRPNGFKFSRNGLDYLDGSNEPISRDKVAWKRGQTPDERQQVGIENEKQKGNGIFSQGLKEEIYNEGQVYTFTNRNEKTEMTFTNELGIVIQAVNLSSGEKRTVYSWNHNKDISYQNGKVSSKPDPTHKHRLRMSNGAFFIDNLTIKEQRRYDFYYALLIDPSAQKIQISSAGIKALNESGQPIADTKLRWERTGMSIEELKEYMTAMEKEIDVLSKAIDVRKKEEETLKKEIISLSPYSWATRLKKVQLGLSNSILSGQELKLKDLTSRLKELKEKTSL